MLWGKNLHICTSCRLPGPTPFLRSAVPSTSAADSAALSCLLFLVTDPETLSCCIYGVTSDLPVLGPLYAPAASRGKKETKVWMLVDDLSADLSTPGEVVMRHHSTGLAAENFLRQQENQCWLPAIRVMESPSISSSDEELVRERKGASPPHSRDQIRS